MFHLGRAMNPSWDQELAAARMDALGIPLKRKVKSLSGGQQAQVSLTMALAKRAPLLVLDEPVSSLDPVARLEFMRDVMASAADTGLTVLISSHVVSELERFCDWLIVLTGGHVQLAGPADDLLAAHRLLTVPARDPGRRASRANHPPHRQRPALHRAGPHRPGPAGGAGHARLAGRPGELRTARHGLPAAPARSSNHRQSCPGRRAARAEHEGGHTMIWVSWRQHRSQAIACLGLLAALAVYAIIDEHLDAHGVQPRRPGRVPGPQPGHQLPGRGQRLHERVRLRGQHRVLVRGPDRPRADRGPRRRAADRPRTRIRHLAAGLEPDGPAGPVAGRQAGPGHRRADTSSARR